MMHRISNSALVLAGLAVASAALFAFPHATEAAVERIGGYTTIQSNDEAPQSNNISVPADAEIMIVTAIGYEFVANQLSGGNFTIAGNALNTILDLDDSLDYHQSVMMYYDVRSLDGTQALAWNLPGTATMSAGILVTYSFYKGINMVSPLRDSGGIQQNEGSLTTGSLTAERGDLLVATVAFTANVTNAVWAGATQVQAITEFNNSEGSAAEVAPTGDTEVSATFNGGDGDGSIMGVVLAAGRSTLAKPPNNLGLVGYWSFNEGTSTTATDFSGNGNIGTLTGPTTLPSWASGKRGTALEFDGTEDYVLTTFTTALSDFTACAWFYSPANSADAFERVIDKDFTNGFWIGRNDTSLNSWGGGVREGSAPYGRYVTLADGAWHHICSIREGTTHTVIGDGGAVSTSGTVSGTALDTTAFRVGAEASLASNGFFDGKVDEVRIYNRALTAAEVRALYGSSAVKFTSNSKTLTQGSSLENGLVGLWTLDGGDVLWTSETTGNAIDRSANNNTGAITNMNRRTSVDAGKLGQAFQFDGSNDYIDMGSLSLIDSATAASVCVWMNYSPSSVTIDGAIVSEFNSTGWMLFVDDVGSITGRTNTIDFLVDNAGGANGRVEGSTNLVTPGAWDHYCGVFVGGTSITLYKNGVQDLQNTTTIVSAVNSSSNAVRIAGSAEGSPGRPLNAKLDDVRIYNRALTAAEVKQLYNLGGVKAR